MCGIAGIISKNNTSFDAIDKTIRLSEAIKHRGPDGEGFLVVTNSSITPCSDKKTEATLAKHLPYWPTASIHALPINDSIVLTLAHRRLSIIDLNETGHQPLCDSRQKYWITYNGEIYNYLELKTELKQIGFEFVSETDTEVVLAAYAAWGFDCVSKFNGMWAFCIYDSEKQICFASRDRFGVKPFYFINHREYFAFASEQKAFVKANMIKAGTHDQALNNYLLNTLIETEPSNFFTGVTELWPGNNLIYNLKDHSYKTVEYYHLKNHINLRNDQLSDKELIDKIQALLEKAIRFRLRSDVEVGTCLSGGIDSSVIAGMIASQSKNPLRCFTSIFNNNLISEEHFADKVIQKIAGKSVKIEPTLDGFINEVDALIYSQDAPIWNTSTYAQFKVMELAKLNGIKVVLDGQGADELFAGYHHHFIAKWTDLLAHSQISDFFQDINISSKTIQQPFVFFIKENLKRQHNFKSKSESKIFKNEFLHFQQVYKKKVNFIGVNEVLLDDIYNTRLKTFLKCEDRCGMWHGVESRTPFSDDIDLINFSFSFNGNRKIQHGISKFLLREAAKSYLPKEVYTRYDKIGFETPMQDWMIKLRPLLLKEIKESNFAFVNYQKIETCDPHNEFENKLLFKLFVLSRWQKVFN